MGSCCKTIKDLFVQIDFFGTSQFLRFRQDDSYKTLTGGIFSMAIVIVIVVTSISTISDSVNRTAVNWTSTTNKISDPPAMTVTMDQTNNFMFGFRLVGIDLNGPLRFFDVTLQKSVYHSTVSTSKETINLSKCTKDQWVGFEADYDRLNMSQWLCPSKNQSFEIAGKLTSSIFETLVLNISKCSNSSNDHRPCYPQAVTDQVLATYGPLLLIPTFVNAIINPSLTENYLTYYLEDNNQILFDMNTGVTAGLALKKYQIQSDNSLFLVPDVSIEDGVFLEGPVRLMTKSSSYNNYVLLFMIASKQDTVYTRSFNRLDSVASYVGGLIGSIIGVMFFMSIFTKVSFQLKMASRIVKFCHDTLDLEFKQLNIFQYLAYLCYGFLKMIKIIKNQWPSMEIYDTYRDEVNRHLDLEFILQRIIFLERAISTLFNENEANGLAFIFNHKQFLNLHEKNRTIIETGKGLRRLLKNEDEEWLRTLSEYEKSKLQFDDQKMRNSTEQREDIKKQNGGKELENQQLKIFKMIDNLKLLQHRESILSQSLWSIIKDQAKLHFEGTKFIMNQSEHELGLQNSELSHSFIGGGPSLHELKIIKINQKINSKQHSSKSEK